MWKSGRQASQRSFAAMPRLKAEPAALAKRLPKLI
jgi:hypothetical protein